MGMPTDPILDIMRRSMANLAFVEAHAGASGPYEVTQIVNTFLGALAHPFEAMRDDLDWPPIAKERSSDREPSSLGDLIRLMRNGLAHGNIESLSDEGGQIRAIRPWNNNPKIKIRTWDAVVTVADMRRFLEGFVGLIEKRHSEFGWYEQRQGAA